MLSCKHLEVKKDNVTVAHPSKKLNRFSTTSETKKETAGTPLGSTKVRGKVAATENMFILLSQPDKLWFGEAMKKHKV